LLNNVERYTVCTGNNRVIFALELNVIVLARELLLLVHFFSQLFSFSLH